MRNPRVADPTRIHRHRYLIEDPVRFGCLVAAGLLLFLPQVPFAVTLLVVGIMQLAPVMMAARGRDVGWSHRWGREVHPSVFASALSMDFVHLAVCALTGALLLIKQFNGVEALAPLAILIAALCIVPDLRICRVILAGDPVQASRQLRGSSFLRDPVMLTALLSSAVACLLDRLTATYLLVSVAFLQLNALLILVDKYLPEIEALRFRGGKALLLEREGRRLWICLMPVALLPLRVAAGDTAAWVGAGVIVLAVFSADVARLCTGMWRGFRNLFRVTPEPVPATMIVVPKS